MPTYKIRLEQRIIYEGTIEVGTIETAQSFAQQLAETSAGLNMGYDPVVKLDDMKVLDVQEVKRE